MRLFFRYIGFLQLMAIILLSSISAGAQTGEIVRMSGKVESHSGGPIVGAMVYIPDTELAALTNVTGVFNLRVPDRYANRKVVISCMGFNNDTIPVQNKMDIYVVLGAREKQHVSDMLVSTQKRLQRELDVPIAISVIDADRQQALNTYQIDEMSRYIPGFSNPLQDYLTSAAAIRGVTSDGGESYSQHRISVFLDGISISRLQSSVIEPFDLERVEVVKGPQGTLFGRGAEIGAINYVRKKPVQYFDFYTRLGYGNFNQQTAEAMVNIPVGRHLANRTAVRYDAHDGYMENLGGGRLNGKKAFAIKNSTSIFLDSNNVINFTIDYLTNNDPGSSFKSKRVGLPDDPLDVSPFTRAFLNGGNELGISRNVINGTLQFDSRFNDRISLSNTFGIRHFDSKDRYDVDGCFYPMLNGHAHADGLQISDELRINWNNGNNLEGFFGASYFMEDNSHGYLFDGDLRYFYPAVIGKTIKSQVSDLPPMVAQGIGQGLEGFAAQLKAGIPDPAQGEAVYQMIMSYKGLAEDAVVNNLEKLYKSLYEEQHFWENTPDIISLSAETVYTVLDRYISELLDGNPQMAALTGGVLGDGGVSGFVRSFNLEQTLAQNPALVAISNVPLSDNYYENDEEHTKSFEGSLFADFTWNFLPKFYLTLGVRGTSEKMETSYESTSMTAPLLGTSLLYHSSQGQLCKVDTSYNSWVGRASVNWKFDQNHNLYLSVSKGRRPAQVYFDYRPDVVQRLSPELLVNYELGIKGLSTYGNFKYYASFFYYNWKNFQSYVFGENENGTMQSFNDDEGKAHAYGFDGSLLYTFNRYVSTFIDYSFVRARYSEFDMNGNQQALHGKRFRQIPDHTFDGGFNFTIPVRHRGLIYFYPSLTVSGKLYYDDENTDIFLQNAYTLFNMNMGYSWHGRRGHLDFDLRVYGKNLSDTQFLVDAGNSGDVIGYPTFVAGAPRTFGAMFRVGLRHNDKKQER